MGCHHVKANTYCRIMQRLPQLRDLDVSFTKCSNRLMAILPRVSRQLKKLNITECIHIDDNGIASLCAMTQGGSTAVYADTLISLKMKRIGPSTRRDEVGRKATRLVLTSLTSLQWLEQDWVPVILEEIIQSVNGTSGNGIHQFCLQNLELVLPDVDNEEEDRVRVRRLVRLTPRMCPHLTHLQVNGDVHNAVLAVLKNLHHLQQLEITNTGNPVQVTYSQEWEHNMHQRTASRTSNCIRQILEANYQTLNKLDLVGMEVDVMDVGVLCGQLEELTLMCSKRHMLEPARPIMARPVIEWQHLTKIDITVRGLCPMGSDQVLKYIILTCKALRHLEIWGSSSPLDVALEELDQSPLPNLEYVCLGNASELSATGLMRVVHSQNQLGTMRIHRCRRIALNVAWLLLLALAINKPAALLAWEPF